MSLGRKGDSIANETKVTDLVTKAVHSELSQFKIGLANLFSKDWYMFLIISSTYICFIDHQRELWPWCAKRHGRLLKQNSSRRHKVVQTHNGTTRHAMILTNAGRLWRYACSYQEVCICIWILMVISVLIGPSLTIPVTNGRYFKNITPSNLQLQLRNVARHLFVWTQRWWW